jgi:hypothetical protein
MEGWKWLGGEPGMKYGESLVIKISWNQIEVRVAKHCKYNKYHRIVQFKMVSDGFYVA